VFFDLFLFATGYKVGPQFFCGLKKNAVPQVSLTIVLCVTSLVAAAVAAKVLGYDCGTAAGLLPGAFTESTVIGTASNQKTKVIELARSACSEHDIGTVLARSRSEIMVRSGHKVGKCFRINCADHVGA
jgi:uncharacterized transporter YbjL